MITEVKEFMCDWDHTPSDDDIKECINLAIKYNCIIKLVWRLQYSGEYKRFIYPTSSFESIKESLPKIYGI